MMLSSLKCQGKGKLCENEMSKKCATLKNKERMDSDVKFVFRITKNGIMENPSSSDSNLLKNNVKILPIANFDLSNIEMEILANVGRFNFNLSIENFNHCV